MSKKLLKTWKYKAGYHIRYEEISGDDAGGKSFVMRSAYTPDGDFLELPEFNTLRIVESVGTEGTTRSCWFESRSGF